jgi:hypothetical protein
MDYVELDCRNVGMRTRALDRREWASVVREAKAKCTGLLCYRTRSKKIRQYFRMCTYITILSSLGFYMEASLASRSLSLQVMKND